MVNANANLDSKPLETLVLKFVELISIMMDPSVCAMKDTLLLMELVENVQAELLQTLPKLHVCATIHSHSSLLQATPAANAQQTLFPMPMTPIAIATQVTQSQEVHASRLVQLMLLQMPKVSASVRVARFSVLDNA